MQKEEITIFCQAPADIIHVLYLYEKNKNTAKISLFCINVESTYQYIKSLSLELEDLQFIPYNFGFSPKKPFSFIKARKELNEISRKYFNNKTNKTIYFFGIWFDWITFFFIKHLSHNNNVIYYKHYLGVSETGKEKYNLKEKYVLFIFYLITGIKFQYTEKEKILRLLFPYKDYNIKLQEAEKIKTDLLRPYLFEIKNIKERSILFFESNMENNNTIKNYEQTLLKILRTLNSCGFNIYIKGHPKRGYSQFITTNIATILSKKIPTELIDIKVFDFVMGIFSVSIAHASITRKNVYSLIHLFDFYDKSVKQSSIQYLTDNSNNQLKFINNISELCI